MQGFKTLWVPGTDHAAISTEVKVTNQLKEEGIDKKELGREKFLERTWQWKEEDAGRVVAISRNSSNGALRGEKGNRQGLGGEGISGEGGSPLP